MCIHNRILEKLQEDVTLLCKVSADDWMGMY